MLSLIGFILLSIGMTPKQVAELLPVTDWTCRNWRRALRAIVLPNDVGKLLVGPLIDIGTMAAGVAGAIFAEIGPANFHTLRQIADMIHERFHLTLLLPTVGRMLYRARSKQRKAERWRKG